MLGGMEPRLTRAAPYFLVPDVAAAADYYQRTLGFRPDYVAAPEFAIVSRDGLAVMFRRAPGPIVPNEAQGGTWDAFFWVEGVRELHAELTARGAVVVYGPVVQESYHMLEFAVRDRDGYVLGFGEPVK